MFESMGYMALIRNLNNLVKYQVSSETLKMAAERIANPEQVKKSKQLPFRFYTAYQNVSGSRLLSDAISQAMDHAVANTPVFEGKTLVAVDCSGSMSGDPMEKAAIFGATLVRANPDADLILYDTQVKELRTTSRMPVVNLAEDIMRQATGGGTAHRSFSAILWAKRSTTIALLSSRITRAGLNGMVALDRSRPTRSTSK
jgi:Uncharacterized protein containing a von Willebrand factor type A (vWA) domain